MSELKSKKATFIGLLDKHNVEIPIIQRDYAQGRVDDRTKAIREKFVGELLDMIKDDKRAVDLDFIYGPINNSVFVPFDGQQRLTTLFLLHWYIAKRAGKLDEVIGDSQPKIKVAVCLRNFTYKVRGSTNEFLIALLDENKGGSLKFEETPRKEILDASWYYSIWNYDPSIDGMLNMLDEIHKQYNELSDNESLWTKLFSTTNPPITFNLLIMNDKDSHLNLTEETYMRMNARGLALTDFENFKAWLEEKCIEAQDENWKNKIDGNWSKMFWELSKSNDKDYDKGLMRFFNVVAAIFAVKNRDKNKETSELEKFLEKITKMEYVPFKDYSDYNCFNKDSLDFIKSCLDKIGNKNVRNFDVNFRNEDTSIYKFENLVLGKLSEDGSRKTLSEDGFRDACVIFYAIFQYLKDKDDAWDSVEFKRWVRAIRNLVENTTLNTEKQFINAIESVNILLEGVNKYSGDILEFLSKYAHGKEEDKLKLTTFTEQIKEEVKKAHLIINAFQWEEEIKTVENHSLFKGQINFLFEDKTPENIENFKKRSLNAMEIFDKNGICEKYRKDAIFLRAFVSQFDDWGQFWGIKYDQEASTWREILSGKNSERWKPVIDKLLNIERAIETEYLNTKFNEFAEKPSVLNADNDGLDQEVCRKVHEDLYKTKFLAYRIEKGCVLRWAYNKYFLSPYNAKADWKKICIGIDRNKILAEFLQNNPDASSNQQIEDNNGGKAPFFHRYDVWFKFNGKDFVWKCYHSQINSKEWHINNEIECDKFSEVFNGQNAEELKACCLKLLAKLNGDES